MLLEQVFTAPSVALILRDESSPGKLGSSSTLKLFSDRIELGNDRAPLARSLNFYRIKMPCEFLIDTDRRLVISRGTETFRYADFLDHMKALAPDPRFKPEFNHLVDCRKFELFDVTAAQIQEMGNQSIFAARSRRAFVVSSTVQFGLARMFGTYREAGCGQLTMVFRDLRDATAWLGLPQDYDPDHLGEPTRIAKSA